MFSEIIDPEIRARGCGIVAPVCCLITRVIWYAFLPFFLASFFAFDQQSNNRRDPNLIFTAKDIFFVLTPYSPLSAPPPPSSHVRTHACKFHRKPVHAFLPFNNPAIDDSYFLSAGEEGSMICWKVHKLTDASPAPGA